MININHLPNNFKKIIQKNYSRILNSQEGLASISITESLDKSLKNDGSFLLLNKKEKDEWKQANLNLWAAYTIYDHNLDGGTTLEELPIANLLLFESAKKLSRKNKIAEEIFYLMEIANQKEYILSNKLKKNSDNWNKLDSNLLLKNNFHKSLGLYISVFIFLDERKINGCEQNKFLNFFKLFLSCRQLADDLFDWRDDLDNKIPTTVTTHLMKKFNCKNYTLSQLEDEVFNNLYPKFHKYLERTLVLAKKQANDISVLEKNNFLFAWADTALKEEADRWKKYQKNVLIIKKSAK